MEVIGLVDDLVVVDIEDKLEKLGIVQSTTSVGVTLIEFTRVCFRITGLEVLFVIGIFPCTISTTCGSGQWFAFHPSTSTVWSGIVVSTSIESPGSIISFVFRDIKLYLSVFTGMWGLDIGNVASSVVAGTIFLLCKRDIVLLVKS